MTVQATFATTLVDEWLRCGVRHAVIAPGSRSTPLALALAEARDMHVHVHLDERSAAFMALGIGIATGIPAVVLTTSGTAAVELHAAVVEASQSRVPLLVCTADRPPLLRDVGAPQAIDQFHLYGGSVRWFFEPGVAEGFPAKGWRSLAARAVAETLASPAGPVHLNLAFTEPLVGEPGPLPSGRDSGHAWHRVLGGSNKPEASMVEEIAAVLRAKHGVIVAGGPGVDADAVAELANATAWPVLADPRSGCRVPGSHTIASFDALLRHNAFAVAQHPDVVLRLGDMPASKVLATWLTNSGAHQVLIDRDGAWIDPDRLVDWVIKGDPSDWCRALAERFTGEVSDNWMSTWLSAERAAQGAIESFLGSKSSMNNEPDVARRVMRALPNNSTLVVSSSMPVRDLEWYAAPRVGVRVVGNRGANGIDGVVSTAVGVALADGMHADGGPTTLLIGDLAFIHDTNGLLNLARRNLDLTIVVVDNAGGGIFSFLPPASTLDETRFEQLFGTPQDVDLAGLITAHGLPVLKAHDAEGLETALLLAHKTPGTHVVLVTTDRHENVEVHDSIHKAVATALDALQ
ncbi:MAG: 2-succinyl-5-enolpyruvyl-6-hydroxy-3-cyclohexene-1-carboxylic-acid synthase [Acidimicrobiales bacterium]